MPLTQGTRFGPYEITASLGAGGMGEVYRARDAKLGRDVALKILPETFASDPDRVARFEREAKTLATLNHPHIAHIYGFEQQHSVSALVMELVEGEDLAERIARGAIPIDEVLPIARQIAEALEAAHEQGIIHRDLKPANIKVRSDGTVKVLDFGLAKVFEGSGGSGRSGSIAPGAELFNSPTFTSPAQATAIGMILGTAAYMAPEQAKGKPVDKRADIWAFGVLVYEMITGRAAFPGETVTDVLAKVIEREPDWTAWPNQTPPRLRELVRRCLVKDPRQRLRDMGDARIALGSDLVAEERTMTRATPRVTAPLIMFALAVAIASGGIGWWLGGRVSPARAPEGVSIRAVLDPRPAAGFARSTLRAFAFTPSGHDLVFAANDANGTRRLYRRQVDQQDAVPLAGTEGAAGPFVSPDGASVGFWADGALKRTPIAGGSVVTIHDLKPAVAADALALGWNNELGNVGAVAFGATWLPDDTIVYGRFAGSLWQVSANGGTPRQITNTNGGAGELAHRLPHALPGGTAVLFTVQSALLGDKSRIEAVMLPSGERRKLVEDGTDGRYLDGWLFFARRAAIFAQSFDPRSLRVSREPIRILADVQHAVGGNAPGQASSVAQFDLSSGGTLAFLPGGVRTEIDRTLAWLRADGTRQPIDVEPRSYLAPRLSPDEQTIAVSGKGPTDEANVLFLVDPQRAIATVLLREAIFAVWTPDGRKLIAAIRRSGAQGQHIYAVPIAGGQPERIVESRFPLWPSGVSPDGKFLAYVESNPMTGNDVWVAGLNPAGAPKPVAQTAANEAYPAISPDGSLLAYTSTETGTQEAYVQTFPEPGRRVQISRGGAGSLSWRRDGTAVIYQSPSQKALMMVSIERGDQLRVGEARVFAEGIFGTTTPVGGFDMARDGSLLLAVDVNPAQGPPPLDQLQLILNALPALPPSRAR